MSSKLYVAAIKIRSAINANAKTKSILDRLKLRKKLTMVLYKNSPVIMGQLKMAGSYITFGEIDDQMLKQIIEKRGKEFKGRLKDSHGKVDYTKFIEINKIKYKPYFNLSPPRGGFERGGIKKGFQQGGALGYRGDKIKELLERML